MHYVTPIGMTALEQELTELLKHERPRLVETVRWAAGNGDRSENGDYIYGKKRLREIDRRVRYLTKQIENAKVIDPVDQQHLERVYFGAVVTYLELAQETERTIQIVGTDEANIQENKISYISPIAKALMKHAEGDCITLNTPNGVLEIEVLSIRYTRDP